MVLDTDRVRSHTAAAVVRRIDDDTAAKLLQREAAGRTERGPPARVHKISGCTSSAACRSATCRIVTSRTSSSEVAIREAGVAVGSAGVWLASDAGAAISAAPNNARLRRARASIERLVSKRWEGTRSGAERALTGGVPGEEERQRVRQESARQPRPHAGRGYRGLWANGCGIAGPRMRVARGVRTSGPPCPATHAAERRGRRRMDTTAPGNGTRQSAGTRASGVRAPPRLSGPADIRSRAAASTEATARGSTGEPRDRAGAPARSRPPPRPERPRAGPGRSRCSRMAWPAPDPTGRGGAAPRGRTPRPERTAPHARERGRPRRSRPTATHLAGRAPLAGRRARSGLPARCRRRARRA